MAALQFSEQVSNMPSLFEWIAVGVILVGVVVAILAISRVIRIVTSRTAVQPYVGQIVMRLITPLVAVIGALYALRVVDVEIGPLLGGLTIFAVVIAYSLQPVIGNIIGSMTLRGSRPIKPGDQIVTNGVEGTVIDIHPRATEILSFDGVTVFVPNLDVLGKALTNRTADYERRTTLPFYVGFDADARKVQHIVERAVREVEGVSDVPRADVLVEGFDESGVAMVARFWHPSEELYSRWIISEVAIAVKESLDAAGVSISYPTRIIQQQPPFS